MTTSIVTIETETGTVRYTVDHESESYGVQIVRGSDHESYTQAENAVEILAGPTACENCDDPESVTVTQFSEYEQTLASRYGLSPAEIREACDRATGRTR